jgi:hypothetical protein
VVVLCVWVGGAAALLPVSPALAHAGATGSAGSEAAASSGADGSDSGASSGGKSGGGGGGGIKSALCNAVNSTPIGGVLGGLTGLTSNCNSGGGSVDPVQAMSSILKATFAAGGVAAPILAPALAEIPDYGASSRAGGAAWLESYVRAMAFAVLGLIVTLSAFRFWIAGVAGQGAFAAAHALVRAVGAALLIAVCPWLFNNLAAVLNVATHALLDQHVVQVSMFAMGGFNAAALAVLFGVAKIPKVGQVGWIFGILLFGLQAITVVGLLLLKVALAVSTTVIFVSMPLLLALWVLPELGWLAERAMRVLFVALCTPVIWALLFATSAVMTANLFGGSGFVDKLFLHPLATIAMFVLALLIPLTLLRHTHGGYGRQPMGMLAGYAGLRLAAGAVSMHIPTQLGGRKQAPPGVQTVLTRDRDGRTSVLERLSVNPADPAGRRAALRFADGRMARQGELVDLLGGTDDSTLTSKVNGSGGPDRGGSAGRAGGAELQALSPEDARSVPAAQRALAGARRATPTIDRGRAALATLAGDAGRQVAAHYREHGYEHTALTLAHNSLRDELGIERREALGTLAGLSEPQLQHVLGQTPPLANNPVSERLADLQRADGLFAAAPAETDPARWTFSAAAPTPATRSLAGSGAATHDTHPRPDQPTSRVTDGPAAARTAPGSGVGPLGAMASRGSGASPPEPPQPRPRPRSGGEG